jgi:hypothetical protein
MTRLARGRKWQFPVTLLAWAVPLSPAVMANPAIPPIPMAARLRNSRRENLGENGVFEKWLADIDELLLIK